MKKKNLLLLFTVLLISISSIAQVNPDLDGPPTDNPELPINSWIPFFLLIAVIFSFFYFKSKINTKKTLI